MTGRLAARGIVITGAGQGLGRAYAGRLAGAGARVAVIDIVSDAARDAAEAINSSTASDLVTHYCTDVTDEVSVASMVAAIIDRWGRIDALVNNAGGALLPTSPFEDFSRAQWERVLTLNLTAPWICASAIVPHMRAAGYGKIVNVSSTTVSRGTPVGLAPYIAAKSGIVGLTRALARELGPAGIRVNAIAPGYAPVNTTKVVHAPEAAEALRQQMISQQCLPVTATADDLCGTVEYLCSADSDFVTGQVINVDGGWSHN